MNNKIVSKINILDSLHNVHHEVSDLIIIPAFYLYFFINYNGICDKQTQRP